MQDQRTLDLPPSAMAFSLGEPNNTATSRILPAVSRGQGGYDFAATTAMLLVHVVAIVGAWLIKPTLGLFAIAVASYYLRMFAITAGYHRYFAHRAFRTSRVFQFILAWLGACSTQRGALWWAAHHRDHHRHSDQAGDLHSPVRDGFFWSHIGWILHTSSTKTPRHNIRDFEKFPELWWIEDHPLVPPIVYGAILLALGGLPCLIWGYFVATTALWHGVFFINSLAHVWGSRRYNTTDTSRNNLALALLTMGEGWHNNHHHFQSAARQGFFWWEIDLSYYLLLLLNRFGIVWNLKAVPIQMLVPDRAPELAAAEPMRRQRGPSRSTRLRSAKWSEWDSMARSASGQAKRDVSP